MWPARGNRFEQIEEVGDRANTDFAALICSCIFICQLRFADAAYIHVATWPDVLCHFCWDRVPLGAVGRVIIRREEVLRFPVSGTCYHDASMGCSNT